MSYSIGDRVIPGRTPRASHLLPKGTVISTVISQDVEYYQVDWDWVGGRKIKEWLNAKELRLVPYLEQLGEQAE